MSGSGPVPPVEAPPPRPAAPTTEMRAVSEDRWSLRVTSCKAHNMLHAEQVYGREHMDRFRREHAPNG